MHEPVQQLHRKTNGMAIASLVLSITGWVILPVVGPILGVVFGYIAKSEIAKTHDEGIGLAVAGIILGAIQLVVCLLIVLLFFGLFFIGALSAVVSA